MVSGSIKTPLITLALVIALGGCTNRHGVSDPDAEVADAAWIVDAQPDVSQLDAATQDASVVDSGLVDAALTDASVLDGGLTDSAVADAAPAVLDAWVPYTAPDFTLTDDNANSPTFGQARTVWGVSGKVLILYFASFG